MNRHVLVGITKRRSRTRASKALRGFLLTVTVFFTIFAVQVNTSEARGHRYHNARVPISSKIGSPRLFQSENAAQAHCPSDQIVWLNTSSGIYHEKGMRWYGNTRQGAYVANVRQTMLVIAIREMDNRVGGLRSATICFVAITGTV